MVQKIKFRFTNYDNYPFDEISSLIFSNVKNKDSSLKLILAVNEAVSNAIRYSVDLIGECKIKITTIITESKITFIISSKTRNCRAIKIKQKMYKFKRKDSWAQAIKGRPNGRGMWIILEGVSKLILDENMNWITLEKKLNEKIENETSLKLLRKMKINKVRQKEVK